MHDAAPFVRHMNDLALGERGVLQDCGAKLQLRLPVAPAMMQACSIGMMFATF
jgi:hypothetical protein